MSELINTQDPRATQSTNAMAAAAGVDLGNGTHAQLVVVATRNRTTAGPFSVSTQLLAANPARYAATIVNTDPVKNLYVGLNGAAAVVGTNTVGPNAAYPVPPGVVAGQVNGIWDAGATGGASILETDA